MQTFLSLALLCSSAFAGLIPRAPAAAVVPHPDGQVATSDQWNTLVKYAKYSAASYVDGCKKPSGNTLVQAFPGTSTSTQAYIARDDTNKELILAFRGTSSLGDILADASTSLVKCVSDGVPYPANALCHTGFQSGFNNASSLIIATMKSQVAAYPGYSISVTGHSLGAAVASHGALSMKYNFPNTKVSAYSFGQPRTGDVNYAAFHDAAFPVVNGVPSYWRGVHTTDGVPQVIRQGAPGDIVTTIIELIIPANNPKATTGYRHHGTEFWQSTEPAVYTNAFMCSGDEDQTCGDSIKVFAPLLGINSQHLTYFGVPIGSSMTGVSYCN